MVLLIAIAVGAALFAIGFAWTRHADKPESWKPTVEGFLGVATPCCTEASLWDELDTVTDDGQRARPASAAEAADWLNTWPNRGYDEQSTADEVQLQPVSQSSEVRCAGEPSGPEIRPDVDDEETLKGIQVRRECTFVKWKAWAGETAEKRPNERHTVWVDDGGLFHGRVDYWR